MRGVYRFHALRGKTYFVYSRIELRSNGSNERQPSTDDDVSRRSDPAQVSASASSSLIMPFLCIPTIVVAEFIEKPGKICPKLALDYNNHLQYLTSDTAPRRSSIHELVVLTSLQTVRFATDCD